jgi:putative ABC transport system permease protein
MDRSLLQFRWLRRLLSATALLWVLWIGYAAVDYFGYRNQFGIHVYYPFDIFFAVLLIWTAAAALLRPQAALIAQPSVAPKPSTSIELRKKGTWLKKTMEANHYYRDPGLSLSSLAEKLHLTTHELSRTINTGLKKSFNDFVNAVALSNEALNAGRGTIKNALGENLKVAITGNKTSKLTLKQPYAAKNGQASGTVYYTLIEK